MAFVLQENKRQPWKTSKQEGRQH